jgi:hypothetical protein
MHPLWKALLAGIVLWVGVFQPIPQRVEVQAEIDLPADMTAAGITTDEWASIQKMIEQASYHFARQTWAGDWVFRAPNHAQGWDVALGPDGLSLIAGNAFLGLNLTGWTGAVLEEGELEAVDAEVARDLGSLVEEVSNTPEGAAYQVQILTPAMADVGLLSYHMFGQLSLDSSETPLRVVNEAGEVVLRLGRLGVVDAAGQSLEAKFHILEDNLTVELRGLSDAVYPLRLTMLAYADPLTLSPSDPENGQLFGSSVAVSGDVIVVGSVNSGASGAAYVFHRMKNGGDTWGEVTKLTPSDPSQWFGESVAVSGDIIVVVASGEDAAYIYHRRSGGSDQWDQIQKLTPAGEHEGFFSVDMWGDTIVIGNPYEFLSVPSGNFTAGAVYIFQRMAGGGDTWQRVQKLTDPVPDSDERFGYSVAVWGDVIVVGEPGQRVSGISNAGEVYVYHRMAGGADAWGLVQTLLPADPVSLYVQEFGISVDVWGDVMVVGAHGTHPEGGAYVFERRSGGADTWEQTDMFLPSDSVDNSHFGRAVAVSGDIIIVGDPGADDPAGEVGVGAVYVFRRSNTDPGEWEQVEKLSVDGPDGLNFGWPVALSDDVLVIGRRADQYSCGSAWVFQEDEDSWVEKTKSLSSTPEADAWYGHSAAVSGDVLVVGTYREGAGGAVYVLHRIQSGADAWGEVKKLAASDLESGDGFGFDVAVWGDVIVVGAPNEDDGTTVNTGEVYVYHRMQGGADNWGEVQRLTGSSPAENGFYGYSVDVWGDIIVVGAWRENGGANASGAAYVYHRMQGGVDNWGEVQRLVSSNPETEGGFGWSTAVWGEMIVVGAQGEGSGGAAYIFNRLQGGVDNWGLVKTLSAAVTSGACFGHAVDVWGDVIAVSAYLDDSGASNRGKGFVFHRMQGGADNWGLVSHISPDVSHSDAYFGQSLAVWGDVIVVGANGAIGPAQDAGAAYVFQRHAGGVDGWGLLQTLRADDAETGDGFGVSVAISGDVIVSGAHTEDEGGADAGAAYIYQYGLFDDIRPSVTLEQAPGQEDPTDASPIEFVVTFSEDVVGFEEADIDFSGSTTPEVLSASIIGTGPTYTVSVTGMLNGDTVVVSIPADVVEDLAGNNNTASTSLDNEVTYLLNRIFIPFVMSE